MNFKKTWKRANDGFTLVELIVVIAILAILAGIAVPAYSGYIKKANKAADLQLLGAVNTAFAAACLENNVDVADVDAAGIEKAAAVSTFARTASAESGWRVGGAWAKVDGAAIAGFSDAFMRYYGTDNTGTFKAIKYEELDYVPGVGFVDITSSSAHTSASYNGTTLYFNQSSIAAVNNSTFMTAEGLGVEGLMGKLDLTTNFAGALLTEDGADQSEALNAVIGDVAFQKTFAGYLGIDTTGMDADQVTTAIVGWAEANPDANQSEMMSNALVLYAAQNSTMSAQDATNLLTGNTKTAILNTLKGTETTEANTTAAMAQAALAYGMYTSYAYSTGDQTLINNASSSNPLDVMNMLEDEGFKTYIAGEQGQKDLEGYLSAMQMIDSAAGNSDVAGDILENGFSNEDLSKLLGDVLK